MICRKGDWISSGGDDEMVMLNIDSGQYLGFNAVGARIWELIETPVSEAALCDRLIEEFDVSPNECRTTVRSFLTRVEKAGAIAISDE